MSLVDLPEEIILLILVRLDLASVAAIEATCRRLRKVIADAKYVIFQSSKDTICSGSSDPFYIVSYYIKWVTTSWTHSTIMLKGFF